MKPTLYRQRLIPRECVRLSGDRILYQDEHCLITFWEALKPRPDLAFGYSCYFPDEGYKISRFYSHGQSFLYWYCDIIKTDFRQSDNSFCFTDLLADVVIYPDGRIRIVDLDELARSLDECLLTADEVSYALKSLDSLLRICYSGQLEEKAALLLQMETENPASRLLGIH